MPPQTAPSTTALGIGAPCAGFTGTFKSDFTEIRLVNGNGCFPDYKASTQITNASVTQTATGWTLMGPLVENDGSGKVPPKVTLYLDVLGNLTGQWENGPFSNSWIGRCVSG